MEQDNKCKSTLKLWNDIDRNSQNLCFVNAALQLLHNISEFKTYFDGNKFDSKIAPVCAEISRIFQSAGLTVESASKLRKLVGQKTGRHEISDGSQQDILEFHDLLLKVLQDELEKMVDLNGLRLINKFVGREKIEKKFLNNNNGQCKFQHVIRNEEEDFKVIKLCIPSTNKALSLNNMICNNFSEAANKLMMKCSECCSHKKTCPQTGNCKLMEATSKKCLVSTPQYLYIQLLRFSSHISLKVETKIFPENLLVLPNGDEYKLLSIANHIGTQICNGHYQAMVKIGSSWMMCDDEKNWKISLQNGINDTNYIFVYEKKSPAESFSSVEKNIDIQTKHGSENYSIDKHGEESEINLAKVNDNLSDKRNEFFLKKEILNLKSNLMEK